MTGENLKSLIEISLNKLEYLKEYEKLTKESNVFIKNSSLDSLMLSIQKKSEIQEKIDSLDKEFLLQFTKLKKSLNISSFDEIEKDKYPDVIRLKSIIQELVLIINNVKDLDNKNQNKIKSDFNELKAEMKNFNINKRGTNSYNKRTNPYNNDHSQISGVFIDNKK